jgi:hypothetical protein
VQLQDTINYKENNMNTTMGGSAELAFRDKLVPADVLSEITVELTEGTRERTTLAGVFTRPSGTMDSAMATVTIFPPSWDWLGANIIESRYNAPTAPQTEGNIIWNAQTCSGTFDIGPLNIHFICDENDDRDIHFYNAQLVVNINSTYTNSDDLSVELTFHAQPDDDGNVWRLGTGDLTQESIYDVDTESTVPVTS